MILKYNGKVFNDDELNELFIYVVKRYSMYGFMPAAVPVYVNNTDRLIDGVQYVAFFNYIMNSGSTYETTLYVSHEFITDFIEIKRNEKLDILL